MKKIADIRHENLQFLVTQYSMAKIAHLLGHSSQSTISQIYNRHPDSKTGKPKNIGDVLARRIEVALGLPEGWMDTLSVDGRWVEEGGAKVNESEFLENTVDSNSKLLLNLTPDDRRVDVIYSTELVPGQFAPGHPIKQLKKTISVTLQEFSPTAFAIIYTGFQMGEMLEHQQPIILDERKPSPGDLCVIQKDSGFMFCVFESESPFGAVFRPKGMSQKYTPDDSYIVYKVMALRNASDVE